MHLISLKICYYVLGSQNCLKILCAMALTLSSLWNIYANCTQRKFLIVFSPVVYSLYFAFPLNHWKRMLHTCRKRYSILLRIQRHLKMCILKPSRYTELKRLLRDSKNHGCNILSQSSHDQDRWENRTSLTEVSNLYNLHPRMVKDKVTYNSSSAVEVFDKSRKQSNSWFTTKNAYTPVTASLCMCAVRGLYCLHFQR